MYRMSEQVVNNNNKEILEVIQNKNKFKIDQLIMRKQRVEGNKML